MLQVKKKVLIIVENSPVPFDTRVLKEACSLHDAGYESPCCVPGPRGLTWDTRLSVAPTSTGTPCQRNGIAPSGTCGNMAARCFGSSGMRGGSICGADFISFRAAILLTIFRSEEHTS